MMLGRKWALLAIIVGVLIAHTLGGCSPQEVATPEPTEQTDALVGAAQPVSSENLKIVTGQRLYVPAYSEVYNADRTTTFDLTIMLSIRNTDFDTPIIIDSILYYDSDGNLVTEFVEEALELPAMATTEGSCSMIPLPLTQTRTLTVPRSTPMCFASICSHLL